MPAPKLQSSFVNSVFKSQTDAAHKFVFSSPVAIGDTILVPMVVWNVSASTGGTLPVSGATDNLGNVYSILSQVESGNSSHHFIVWLFCRVTVAGTPTITPTLAINNNLNSIKGRAYCWDSFYASPVDKIVTGTGGPNATGATTASQTLTFTAPFFTISAFTPCQQGGTITVPSGFTVLDNSPVQASNELDFACGYLDTAAASSAAPAVSWANGASVNGTVGTTLHLKQGCRVRGRVSAAGIGATGCTVDVWPSGDTTTSVATRYGSKTIDSNGYILVPADVAWQKAVGSTVAMDVDGTSVLSVAGGAARKGVGTIEIGVA